MKVLFIKSLRGKGAAGEIREVPDGYAMNFLIGQGYAVKATDAIIKQHLETKQAKQDQEKSHDTELSQKLSMVHNITVPMIVSQKDLKGHLYKGIRAEEIISEIRKQTGVILDKVLFKSYEPIKTTGNHIIKLSYKDISATFTVTVK